MFEAVLFDMDGVLVDSEPLHFATTNEVLAPFGCRMEASDYELCIGMGEEEFFAGLVRRFDLPASASELAAGRLRLFTERLAVRPLPPMPGALECLLRLGMEGFRLGLATSAFRLQAEQILGGLGIRHRFEVAIAIEDVDRGKPAPDLYLAAAQAMGLDPSNCIVIEDAAFGVEAALAAGMTAVALPHGAQAAEACRRAGAVHCLAGLDELTPELVHSFGSDPHAL